MYRRSVFLAVLLLSVAVPCLGQGVMVTRRKAAPANSNLAQASPAEGTAAISSVLPVSAIKLDLQIRDQVATVRAEHLFRNETDEILEGSYYYPVPEGATLLEFAVYDGDQRRLGQVKEKEEARTAYKTAAAQDEDPAILEMTRRGWFQTRVYPIPPHADKRVEIVYSYVLPQKAGMIDFEYPLGRGYKKLKIPVGAVEINLDVRSSSGITNFFSPTHRVDAVFDGDRHATARVSTTGGGESENFELLYSHSDQDLGASLLTFRKEGEDGYFLLMLSPKVEFDPGRISGKDVLFVVDVSGSMEGDKLAQAKAALRFGLEKTLGRDDRFNIVSFDSAAHTLSDQMTPVSTDNINKALAFVDKLRAIGGTNINDALVTAMQMFAGARRVQNLIFITDGEPTDGITEPATIVANVRAANAGRARLFCFGVGFTINNRLLEQLAVENRGATANIADQENLNPIVSGFFDRVSQPVLSNLKLDFGRLEVDKVYPVDLPDLYTRSQIKVFGRYSNPDDLRDAVVSLTGEMNEREQRFEFGGMSFPAITNENGFLPKLWATERVSALLKQERLYNSQSVFRDEIVKLAQEFNLVTPYTSMYVPTAQEAEREKLKESTRLSAAGGVGTVQDNRRTISAFGIDAIVYDKNPTVAEQTKVNRGVFGPAAFNAPGTVTDANGAVVPAAAVTIVDQHTGMRRDLTTDSAGNFSIAGLPPGKYSVQVAAPGFKTTQITDVSVQPGQTTLGGVHLEAANISEAVTVTGSTPIVTTDSAHSSSVIESRSIEDLPNLDPVHSLTRLIPGAFFGAVTSQGGQPAAMGRRPEFGITIGAAHPRSIGHTLDGQENGDIDGRPGVSIDNVEAVEMLHVLTTRATGDVSLTGTAAINLVTPAGSNQFHGSVFDYYLNRGLGALSPVERRNGILDPPTFKNTLYGGVLGGPIRRDRAFFFASLLGETEISRRFVDSTASFVVPTNSTLARLLKNYPESMPLLDIFHRGPLATIGTTGVTRTFTFPVLGTPVEFGQVARSVPSSAEGYEASSRFSLNATPRDQVELRYWYDSRSSAGSTGRLESGYTAGTGARAQLAGFHWNRLLSPLAVNDLLIGFGRTRTSLAPENPSLVDLTQAEPGPSVLVGLPGFSYGSSPLTPQSHVAKSFNVADLYSRIAGRHNLKLGLQLRHRAVSFNYLPGLIPQFDYLTFDDFVQDRPLAIVVAAGNPRFSLNEMHQHYYIDDGWRVRDNLTLFFGLSYETANQPVNRIADRIRERETESKTALFNPALPIDVRTIPGVSRDNNNVAPRIGFAYTPRFRVFGRHLFGRDELVVRGGASISYDATAFWPAADVAASSPNVLLAALTPASGIRLPKFPATPSATELTALLDGDPRRFARTIIGPAFSTPYSIRWHLAASRAYADKLVIEASYSGARSVGLIRASDGNPSDVTSPNPENRTEGPVRTYTSSGQSTYHALQLRTDLRIRTLEGSLGYTFSKLTDDVPMSGSAGGYVIGTPGALGAAGLQTFAQNPFNVSGGERGVSSLDRRHVLAGHLVWSLPLPRPRSHVLARLLNGWQAASVFEVGSGAPYTPMQQLGYSSSSALFGSSFADRFGSIRPFLSNPGAPPDVVAFSNAANQFLKIFVNPDGSVFQSPTGFIVASRSGYRSGSTQEARFVYNDYFVEMAARAAGLPPDGFGATFAAGRPYGDAGRNTLIGPLLENLDFALLKNTKLNEKISLQVRAEFFNMFNHPSRNLPSFILETAGGRGFADPGERDATPRRIRIGLKLSF